MLNLEDVIRAVAPLHPDGSLLHLALARGYVMPRSLGPLLMDASSWVHNDGDSGGWDASVSITEEASVCTARLSFRLRKAVLRAALPLYLECLELSCDAEVGVTIFRMQRCR